MLSSEAPPGSVLTVLLPTRSAFVSCLLLLAPECSSLRSRYLPGKCFSRTMEVFWSTELDWLDGWWEWLGRPTPFSASSGCRTIGFPSEDIPYAPEKKTLCPGATTAAEDAPVLCLDRPSTSGARMAPAIRASRFRPLSVPGVGRRSRRIVLLAVGPHRAGGALFRSPRTLASTRSDGGERADCLSAVAAWRHRRLLPSTLPPTTPTEPPTRTAGKVQQHFSTRRPVEPNSDHPSISLRDATASSLKLASLERMWTATWITRLTAKDESVGTGVAASARHTPDVPHHPRGFGLGGLIRPLPRSSNAPPEPASAAIPNDPKVSHEKQPKNR